MAWCTRLATSARGSWWPSRRSAWTREWDKALGPPWRQAGAQCGARGTKKPDMRGGKGVSRIKIILCIVAPGKAEPKGKLSGGLGGSMCHGHGSCVGPQGRPQLSGDLKKG